MTSTSPDVSASASAEDFRDFVMELRSLLRPYSGEERRRIVQGILQDQPREVAERLATSPWWLARPKQLRALRSKEDTVLAMAGRGWGKNWVGSHWVIERARSGEHAHIAVVGETAADVRDYMVEGPSGILSVAPDEFSPDYQPSKRRLVFPNGAVATTYSGDKPDQLRGFSGSLMWMDELAKYRYHAEIWDGVGYTLREGDEQQLLITTTPRPIDTIKDLVDDPGCEVVRGSSLENEANLGDRMLRKIQKVEGTRIGRQEIYAEIIDANPGALWSHDMFSRVPEAPNLVRVVVGVDPSGGGDEVGVVTAGLADDGTGYVLSDRTLGASPMGWAKAVKRSYDEHSADKVIGEVNFGGDMVESTIRSVDDTLPVKQVRASRGKAQRAEPVASLYEQHRVRHVGTLPELEAELTQWDPETSDWSPNRLDALVWALTELMLQDDDRTTDAFAAISELN